MRVSWLIRPAEPPQEKIKTISRTNPPPGKVSRSRPRHSARPDCDLFVVATDRRKRNHDPTPSDQPGLGQSRGPVHSASLWARRLRRILRHHPLRHRLRLWPRGAKGDHRHRNGGADCGGTHRQPAPDVRLRRSAQRDGAQAVQAVVDAIRAEIGRTQHLRAVLQSRAHAAVLAMASDAWRWSGTSTIRRSPWR